MHLNSRTNLYLAGGILVFAAFVCVFTVCFADESQAEKPDGNTKCYVCHPDLMIEELTTSHLDMDVTCDECHGPSIEHMHDEMLMTKPDLLFGRSEVRKMCSNPTCHKPGGERIFYGRQDHKNPAAVEDFYKKWLGRVRPNGRAVTHDSVCTDCHGTHNLDKPREGESEDEAEWVSAFNGRDLAGWEASGSDSWTVKSGRLIGTPPAKAEGSSLWSEAEYEDYLLAVTFRATWPVRAGIWLRPNGYKVGPRIEIFESDGPIAFTGSVFIPGTGLVLVNVREDSVDREGWNTISAKVEGDRVQVWLNGEEVGAVRAHRAAKGKIGLYIGRQKGSEAGQFVVREVLIQKLVKKQEEVTSEKAD